VNPDVDAARSAVARAEYNLESARLNLALARHSNTVGKAVRDLEYAVAWHERHVRDLQSKRDRGEVEQSAVDEARDALDRLRLDLESARSAAAATLAEAEDRVRAAEEALAKAQRELADLQRGPDAVELDDARNRVAQAELTLATAQETLAGMEAGPDEKDVKLARARCTAAVAALEEAREALEGATLVAPFAGTVVSVGAEEGDLITGGTAVVTLASLERLRVLAWVDETEIGQVVVGQEAEITFDALPGRRFSGEVLEVPIEGRLTQNVVTYEVPISLEGIEGAALRPGMTANVRIVTGRREGVLVVPVLAVQMGEEGSVVTVEDGQGGRFTTRVELGVSDGQYAEVVRGLMEGDRVVVRLDTTSTQTTFGFGQRGGTGLVLPGMGMGR